MMAEAVGKLAIRFCVLCKGTKIRASKKYLYCINCMYNNNDPTFKVHKDVTLKEVEQRYEDIMIYCYNCGDEVVKESGRVMCIKGCRLVNFPTTIDLGKDVKESEYVSQLFLLSKTNWESPDILIKDCEDFVDFYVAINLNEWVNNQDGFNVSIASPEINKEKEFYGNFKCCYSNGIFSLYHCRLPIPLQFVYNKDKKIFRYKYVVRITSGISASGFVSILESLSVYNPANDTSCRYVNIEKDRVHFDLEAIPKSNYGRLFLPSTVHFATGALSLYMTWAILEQKWIYVDDSEIIEKEIVEKFNLLSHLIKCLHQRNLFIDGKAVEFKDESLVLEVNKGVFETMAAVLRPLPYSTLKKFLSGLIVVSTMLSANVFDTAEKCFDGDHGISSYNINEIVKSLYLPMIHDEFIERVRIIRQFSPELLMNTILPAAIKLCNILISLSQSQWMDILPLLHVIKLDQFVPGQPYQLPATEEEINDILYCGVNIELVTDNLKKCFDSPYHMAPFFKLDWLMCPAFLSMCSFEGLLQCLYSFPETAPFACWEIGRKHITSKALLENYDFTEIFQILKNNIIIPDKNIPQEEFTFWYQGTSLIIQELVNSRVTNVQLFQAIVQLTLTVLERSPLHHAKLKDEIKSLSDHVRNWVEVIHGFEFKEIKELKDWCGFLSLEMNGKVREEWNKNLILTDRFNQMNILDKINILPLTDDLRHDVLDMLFSNVLPSLIEFKDDVALQSLKTSTSADKLKVLRAFFSLNYSNMIVIFGSLFTSLIWPLILELYESTQNTQPKGVSSTSPNSAFYLLCEQALHLLKQFFNNLQTRQITPSELEDILNAGNLMTTFEIIQSFMLLNSFKDDSVTIEPLKKEIKAYQSFKLRNTQLYHFSCIFSDLPEAQMAKMKDTLSSDHTRTPVQLLWEWKNESISYNFCAADVSSQVLGEVYQLTHHDQLMTSVFRKLFADQMESYLKNNLSVQPITLHHIVNDFWNPLCRQFKDDLYKLFAGLQLPLNKVTYFFKDINDLQMLTRELDVCCDVIETDKNGIDNVAQKILDYQELCKFSFVAPTLMQVKETLGMTGDFNALIAAMTSEEPHAEMTLAAVEKMAHQTACVLNDISSNHRKSCLDAFCSCTSLVQWISGVAKNVGQLHSVIQIASQLMEKEHQLLESILKFGSAFAPLIYEVDKNEGCEALINRCKELWSFLSQYPDIAHVTMDSCYARLGDLKIIPVDAIYEIQKRFLREMIAINAKGTYFIQAIPGKIIHSPEEVIQLKLQDDDQNEGDFTLREVRLLQNKFALVAAIEPNAYTKFIEMLHQIEKITLQLVKLQEAGHIDYTHFNLVCGCSEYIRDELYELGTSMENSLMEWKEIFGECCKLYPHLNYYTSQQLLDLQQELGQLKRYPDSVVTDKLKQLLLSVTPYPSQQKIMRAFKNAVTKDLTLPASAMKIKTFPRVFCKLIRKLRSTFEFLTKDYKFPESVVAASFLALGNNCTDRDLLCTWCKENKHNELFLNANPTIQSIIEEMRTILGNESEEELSMTIENVLGGNEQPKLAPLAKQSLSIQMTIGGYFQLVELGEFLAELANIEGFYCVIQEKELNELVLEIEDISLPIDTCIG